MSEPTRALRLVTSPTVAEPAGDRSQDGASDAGVRRETPASSDAWDGAPIPPSLANDPEWLLTQAQTCAMAAWQATRDRLGTPEAKEMARVTTVETMRRIGDLIKRVRGCVGRGTTGGTDDQ